MISRILTNAVSRRNLKPTPLQKTPLTPRQAEARDDYTTVLKGRKKAQKVQGRWKRLGGIAGGIISFALGYTEPKQIIPAITAGSVVTTVAARRKIRHAHNQVFQSYLDSKAPPPSPTFEGGSGI